MRAFRINIISPVAEAESFAYCRFMPSAEEDTDEDILLQALLAAAQTAEGRDMPMNWI